jgi:hypothetical protein
MEDVLSGSPLLRAPSVGALVKKIISVNPELGTHEIIQMIRQSIQRRGQLEVIDEELALKLAKETLTRKL